METLSEFDMEIEYKPGKTNVVTDALSRPPTINAILQIVNNLEEEIKEAYNEDHGVQELLKHLANSTTTPQLQTKAKYFAQTNGLLYMKGRLYVPINRKLRLKILQEYHESPTAGHLGVNKTYELLSRN